MENIKKYNPNHIVTIDRDYLIEGLTIQESSLLNKNGDLDDSTFEELEAEIIEGLWIYLSDCYVNVESRLAREKRNVNAKNSNPHYVVYWRNESAYQLEFKRIKVYSNLSDARNFIHDGIYSNSLDEFKILEVRDGIEIDKKYALKSNQ